MPDKYQILNMNNLKVAAFDWDNTLALSRDAIVRSINDVLAKYGLGDWSKVESLRNPDLSFKDNFSLIFADKAQEAYELYSNIYMQKTALLTKAPLYASEVLQYLRENNVYIVLVTNKERKLLEFELPLLYKKDYFTRIVCGHEALRDKPSPEQLIYAVNGLVDVINTDNVWMIGDSPMDSSCALKCNARAIRIGSPIWKTTEQVDEKIDYFSDFADFLHFIKGSK